MLVRVNNVPVDRSFRLEVGDVIRVGTTLLRLDAVDTIEVGVPNVSSPPKQELPDDLSEVLNKVVAFLGLPKPDGSWTGMALAFAKWLAFAQAFVADPDGQHQATWTETMLRVIGTRGMMKGSAEAMEAAEIADAVLREKVKRFPPRMVSHGDELSPDEEDEIRVMDLLLDETKAWREATGCNTPGEVASIVEETNASVDAGLKNLADLREQVAGWREATGCASLDAFYAEEAKHSAAMSKTYRDLDDLQNQVDEWKKATGHATPNDAAAQMGEFASQIQRWIDATGCNDPTMAEVVVANMNDELTRAASRLSTEHEKRRANIQAAKDDIVEREKELTALRVQVVDWQNGTNCDTSEEAAELIADIKHKWELEILKCVDVTNERNIARRTAERLAEETVAWRKATGWEVPGSYAKHLEREASVTDARDRMIAERDQMINEYAKEIDRLRDATRVALRDCADAEQSADRAVEAIRRERDEMDRVSVDATKRADGIANDLNKAVSILLDIRNAFGGATVDRICEIGKTALIPLPKPETIDVGNAGPRSTKSTPLQ